MSDTKDLELWCHIVGDDCLFSVDASRSTFIYGLKKLIKDERPNFLQKFDAGSLVLWKVHYF